MDFWQQELLVPQGAVGSAKIGYSQTNIVRSECWVFFSIQELFSTVQKLSAIRKIKGKEEN